MRVKKRIQTNQESAKSKRNRETEKRVMAEKGEKEWKEKERE